MYCNQEIETMTRANMRQLQTEKLRKTIRWIYEKSPFYREKMDDVGLTDQSVQTLDDLSKMPFTTKEDLVCASPFGFLATPISSTIRMRMVGETNPVTRAYTSGDVGRNVEMMARCLIAGGINMASILELSEEYSSENALSVQYAGEVLGATIIPAAMSKLERGLEMADQLGVTTLASNSQQMLQFLVAGQALEYDLKLTKIATLLCLNEKVKNNIEDHLTSRFKAKVFNFYAPPEIGCAGVAFDCEEKNGMHLQEDYFYPEVISLTDQQVLKTGCVGELVITSLALEAMPVIRYRTGQIVSLNTDICRCGRTLVRLQVP